MVHFKQSVEKTRHLWRLLRLKPAEMVSYQQEQLEKLVQFARANSPLYQRLYSHLPAEIHDVTLLPPVIKPFLMANFDDWSTNRAITREDVGAFLADKTKIGQPYHGDYLVCTSSGSTGQPGIFVQEPKAESTYRMVNMLQAKPAGRSSVRRRIRWVTVCATGDHFGSYSAYAWLKRSRERSPILKMIFSQMLALGVTRPLNELVKELNSYQPGIMVGYSTMIASLADEQKAGRLHIHPQLVSIGGEGLAPGEYQRIAEAFQCPVHDGYASVESPYIAISCTHGWLHVDTRRVILEPVDEDYQPVPPGVQSHTVLITNLLNRIQPIIRYDLGDSIIVRPDPCPCGNSLPAIRVEGRKNDRLRFKDQHGELKFISPMVFIAVLETQPGLHRYQLIQTGPSTLQIKLNLEPEAEPEQVWQETFQRLRAYFEAQGIDTVVLERSDELPTANPKTGKFHYVSVQLDKVSAMTTAPEKAASMTQDLHA